MGGPLPICQNVRAGWALDIKGPLSNTSLVRKLRPRERQQLALGHVVLTQDPGPKVLSPHSV